MLNYLQLINSLLVEFCKKTGATVTLFDRYGNCITHRGRRINFCSLL